MIGLNSDSLNALAELRTLTNQFFSDQKLSAKRIITVSTRTISSRLLSFEYYNDSQLGASLSDLNNTINQLSGEVEIFTV